MLQIKFALKSSFLLLTKFKEGEKTIISLIVERKQLRKFSSSSLAKGRDYKKIKKKLF
jgi:hypothetical protein